MLYKINTQKTRFGFIAKTMQNNTISSKKKETKIGSSVSSLFLACFCWFCSFLLGVWTKQSVSRQPIPREMVSKRLVLLVYPDVLGFTDPIGLALAPSRRKGELFGEVVHPDHAEVPSPRSPKVPTFLNPILFWLGDAVSLLK